MRNYDPKEVSVICGGHKVRDFAAEMVRVEPNEDDFNDVAGAQGEVSRSRTSDRRATVTLVIKQTSPSNDVLSEFARTDRETPNGGGVFSFQLIDRQGTTLVDAEEAWVMRKPDLTFSNEITNREWTIRLAEANYFVGGN